MTKTLALLVALAGCLLVAKVASARGPSTPVFIHTDGGVTSATVNYITLCDVAGCGLPGSPCLGSTTLSGGNLDFADKCPNGFKPDEYNFSIDVSSAGGAKHCEGATTLSTVTCTTEPDGAGTVTVKVGHGK